MNVSIGTHGYAVEGDRDGHGCSPLPLRSTGSTSSILGHSDETETLRTYSHLWRDSDTRTRAAVDVVGSPPPHRFVAPGPVAVVHGPSGRPRAPVECLHLVTGWTMSW